MNPSVSWVSSARSSRANLVWAGLFGLGGAATLVMGSMPTAAGTFILFHELGAIFVAQLLGVLALVFLWRTPSIEATPLPLIFLLAASVRGVAALASPLLEDDHYRYLWDGLRTATALDPYRLEPAEFFDRIDLAPLWQPILSGINNPELPTLYGPMLQGLFAMAYLVAPAELWPLKLFNTLADLGLMFLLWRLGVSRRSLGIYALHPLALKEGIGSAHPDAWVVLFLLLALYAKRRAAAWAVGLALGAAVAVKVSAMLVVPLFMVMAPAHQCSIGARMAWAVSVRPNHLDGGRLVQVEEFAGRQQCGSSSSIRLAGCVGSLASTSLR